MYLIGRDGERGRAGGELGKKVNRFKSGYDRVEAQGMSSVAHFNSLSAGKLKSSRQGSVSMNSGSNAGKKDYGVPLLRSGSPMTDLDFEQTKLQNNINEAVVRRRRRRGEKKQN